MDEKFLTVFKKEKGIEKVYPHQNMLDIQLENIDIVPEIIGDLVNAGAKIKSVTEMKPDLEQIFLDLTEIKK
jgi:hypothetical protein